VAAASSDVEAATLTRNGSPPITTNHPSDVLCPLPRRIERVRVSITSPLVQPSPNGRRVGIRIVTFEACSGFTRVTARRIAQPPKVTFVTRLRSRQLPSETARQLPDLSTIIRVEPSSTDDSRPQGALPIADICRTSQTTAAEPSQSSSLGDGSCRTPPFPISQVGSPSFGWIALPPRRCAGAERLRKTIIRFYRDCVSLRRRGA
jgi:hypothetical protein